MTVLLKIVNNSMTALLKSLSVLLESIDLLFYKSGGLSPLLLKVGGGGYSPPCFPYSYSYACWYTYSIHCTEIIL